MTREQVQRRVIAAYFDGINDGRHEDVAALFASAGELVAPGTDRRRGGAEITAYLAATASRYERHRHTPTREIHADGSATVESHVVATLRSAAQVEFDAVNVFDFDAAGAIARTSLWYDSAVVNRQLGEGRMGDDSSLKMPQHDQVGIIVEDLEAAMAELGGAVRVEWTGPHDRQLGKWHLRVALSTDGRLELIEPEAGSPWESPGGPRLDHLAYFVDDLPGQQRRFIEAGLPMAIDGREFGGTWSYHASSHGGMRIELVDAAQRETYFARARGTS